MSILEEISEIRKIDKSNELELCLRTHEYCRDAFHLAEQIHIPERLKISRETSIEYSKPTRIIVAGMGGSAIGGEILKDWLSSKLQTPIEVCRDYKLPVYADEETLVFTVSYSGNTEETLSSFIDAIKRGCMVISLTSGGHLLSFSRKFRVPCVALPKGLAPRVALPYTFLPMPVIMEKMGLYLKVEEQIGEVVEVLRELSEEVSPNVSANENVSKRLALELKDTIPIFYGFRHFKAVARRLKCQFNENTKILSFYDAFPELDHNEIVGWESPENLTKLFSVVLIRDLEEPPEIRHRIELTKSLALTKARKVLEINARGKGLLARIFSVIFIGDIASIYLAVLRRVDPAPVPLIDALKAGMREKLNLISILKEEVQRIASQNDSKNRKVHK